MHYGKKFKGRTEGACSSRLWSMNRLRYQMSAKVWSKKYWFCWKCAVSIETSCLRDNEPGWSNLRSILIIMSKYYILWLWFLQSIQGKCIKIWALWVFQQCLIWKQQRQVFLGKNHKYFFLFFRSFWESSMMYWTV